jgi:hypothetical protein
MIISQGKCNMNVFYRSGRRRDVVIVRRRRRHIFKNCVQV